MNLNEARLQIDKADEQLLDAFIKRMEASKTIANIKKSQGLPTENKQREAEVLKARIEKAGPEMAPYVAELYECLFALSKKLQNARNAD